MKLHNQTFGFLINTLKNYHFKTDYHPLLFISIPAEFDIQMKRCFAFDETDTALTLVDDRGCSVERLISDFTYDRSTGSAEAVLYSMFRLPHSNRTYFQCDVAICAGTCPKPKCEDIEDSLKLSAEGQLTQIEQEGSENDPFDRPEDDTVTTSTSVFVAQPGSAASGKNFCFPYFSLNNILSNIININ